MDDFETSYELEEDNEEYVDQMIGMYEDCDRENRVSDALPRASKNSAFVDRHDSGPLPTHQHYEEGKGPDSWPRPPVGVIDPRVESISKISPSSFQNPDLHSSLPAIRSGFLYRRFEAYFANLWMHRKR